MPGASGNFSGVVAGTEWTSTEVTLPAPTNRGVTGHISVDRPAYIVVEEYHPENGTWFTIYGTRVDGFQGADRHDIACTTRLGVTKVRGPRATSLDTGVAMRRRGGRCSSTPHASRGGAAAPRPGPGRRS